MKSRLVVSVVASLLASAQFAFAGDTIVVDDAWVQAPMPGATEAAAYMQIRNSGSSDDRLLSVSSRLVGRIEMHEIKTDGGMASMRPILYGVKIPAGKAVAFSPVTMHLMLSNERLALSAGTELSMELNFQHAGRIKVVALVRALGAGDR